MSVGWPSQESLTFLYEVGPRAALHSQQLPRDDRWWKGLWR